MNTQTKRKAPKGKKKTAAAKETITVKIGSFPGGAIKEYSFEAGTILRDAVTEAGFQKVDGLDIRVNGQSTSNTSMVLPDGAQVLIFTKIRGN